MTITDIASYAIGVFLLIGAFFSLVGSIGMLKLPDSMTRLHAPTKVGTMDFTETHSDLTTGTTHGILLGTTTSTLGTTHMDSNMASV